MDGQDDFNAYWQVIVRRGFTDSHSTEDESRAWHRCKQVPPMKERLAKSY